MSATIAIRFGKSLRIFFCMLVYLVFVNFEFSVFLVIAENYFNANIILIFFGVIGYIVSSLVVDSLLLLFILGVHIL